MMLNVYHILVIKQESIIMVSKKIIHSVWIRINIIRIINIIIRILISVSPILFIRIDEIIFKIHMYMIIVLLKIPSKIYLKIIIM